MKKVMSLLLALVMALSLLPTAAWAEGNEMAQEQEMTAKEFIENSHAFTWGEATYEWRFGALNSPAGRMWHLYAAAESVSNDSLDGWTDCGGESEPLTHLTEGTLEYAAAAAMKNTWESLSDNAAREVNQAEPNLVWLADMMALEATAYRVNEDVELAQTFLNTNIKGIDGGSATLVPATNVDDLMNAWYDADPSVRAALQKTVHGAMVINGEEYTYNFTQMLHRTLNNNQGGDSGNQGGNQGDQEFEELKAQLKNAGFTAPQRAEITFPEGLEQGVDYDYTFQGTDLRIVLKKKANDGANWLKAVRCLDDNSIGLTVRIDIYGQSGDEYAETLNGNGGYEYIMGLTQVNSKQFSGNGEAPRTSGGTSIATVNRVDGLLTIVPMADMNHHSFCVVWGDENHNVTRREMVNIYITMEDGPFAVNDTYQQVSAISAERLANLITLDSEMEGKWNVSYENGKILLVAKETLENGNCNIGELDWTKLAAPEGGYTWQGWKDKTGSGSSSSQDAITFGCWVQNGHCNNNMIFQVTWKDADGRELVEELNILATSSGKPYYARVTLGGKTAKAIDNLGLDADKLRDAGIHFTYDKDLGYFHAYYDKDRMPDYDALVGTIITLMPPEGAVTFRRVHEDGNGDPRCDNEDMTQRTQGMLENEKLFRVEDGSEEAVRARSIPLVETQEFGLDGIRVCMSRTRNYRSVTVAWYDENGNVIGIDYVYGQNDDFVQRTRLKGVADVEGITDKNERGEVNAPVAVGAEGAELICDRYSQTGDGRTQYFELTLLRDSNKDGEKTIYIPYGYFGLRYEDIQDNLNEQPEIIVHHYNADRSGYKELKGRYTPQGIAFDTKDFSPFTVSLGGNQGGEQGDFEDAGDNVTRYHLEDEGRVCIIEGVNTSIRQDIPVELGIDWRRSLGDVRVIGIPVEIVRALAQAGRNTIVYGRYGIMTELTPTVLADIAGKLAKIPENENNLLWIRADYRNCDAEQGNAYAFRCLLWLGEDDRNVYVTPEGSVLRIGIDNSERLAADGTKFVVYTPNQDDKLTTDNGLTVDYFKRTKAEFSDLYHDYEQFMVNTRSGGVFVVAPEEYKLQMEWPWPGLNGDNDGGDNIGEFQCWTDGKDWNGETDMRYMVIHSLRNMDGGQDVIELGVNWRSRDIGDVQNVGITPEVLNEMAAAEKPVVLYGVWNVGMTIPAAAISDMAAKLTAMNQGKSENLALLWLKVEYCNCDGPAGNAYAFCVRAYLGDTHYVLPENLNYTFRLDGQVNNYKAFTLYCPEDQDEVGTALVEQKNDISYTDERDQSGNNSWRVYEFTANHDGMFVIAPVDYSVKQNWPWYGVPLPRWHPSDEAIKPTQADAALQALYDNDAFGENGFKFPVLDLDIHFTFPVELKEWKEGCGNDWDYRLIQEPAAGRVTIKVNLGSRDRWEKAVRNSNDGALSDGVFFGYYFGNSTNEKPMDYGFDWYGGGVEQITSSFSLSENFEHTNALHLAALNQKTANSTMLTMSREGENWWVILVMSDGKTSIANAAAKYALQLKIEATEDVSIIVGADNGVPADKERIHVTGLHSDWTAIVPTDGSVFLRTIAGKNYDSAGTDNQNKIGTLTVDAPAGYTLKEWTSTHEYEPGATNSAPLQKDRFQTVKFLWGKDGAPDILENVVVECQNSREVFFELEEGNVKVKIPTEQEILPAAKQRVLEDNGITVTYDESNGYFVTAVDAHKIKDIAQLETKLTVPAPAGAVAYTAYFFGGDTNPTNWVGEMTKAKQAMDEATPISIEKEGLPSIALIQLREIPLENGITVYYAGTQMYDCRVIRWLDKDGKILEYSCIYGRNGDLSTAVDTKTVAQAPTTAVDVPTLVGAGELYCDITPQTKMDNQLFLLLRVSEGTEIGPDGVAIYLPYSDFGMTAEQGLALAALGIKPVVWHYLNESCTEKEIIEGEYTAAGIKFVTHGFSPFLINAVQTAGGETGGGETGGTGTGGGSTGGGSTGGSTGGGLSSGWSGPQGWTLKTSDKAASATDYSGGIYGLTFKSSASFASFRGVQVDGKTIAAKNYIAEAGSIEVYLKAVYLQTLKDGKHTVTILSSEGNVTMEFTVGGVNTSPTTGDMGVALYAVLALSSIGGMAVLPRRRREK